MLDHVCPHCSAIPPTHPTTLDAVPVTAFVRRACDIALTGRHPITCIAVDNPASVALAHSLRRHGVVSYATTWCPCGQLGAPRYACTCTPDQIRVWQQRKNWTWALASDLIIEVASLPYDALVRYVAGDPSCYEPESVRHRWIRATQYAPRPAPSLTAAAQHLLQQATARGRLPAQRVPQICAVAHTIAWLDAQPHIGTTAMAEALTYWPGGPGAVHP
ncbi:MAG: hypothetical protein HC828_06210 [Blastochloris sp.]|nr:hypothetical protein [Blastochloris sp.]